MASEGCCLFLEIILAILLPPLGVFLHYGCCSLEFCISVLLTILGYIPGMIYAIYAITVDNPDRHRRDYYEPIVA
ncbi:hydrophobic protein OSR8 [Dendrobium catenatum]|uniref:Hydrophobic protein OSR8 n=2 Tax=Dendrobium TaxID=37818 RepID=A0A8T3A2R5_DENNO|nr:hydrophobic protein OSR8 [Dendrobium catenatum]KAI0488698.1 hypothetical protein KFK09_028537 [Dendrobium nobile]PKU62038.1 Hydrophobic protein OSR8 [Dendrobium catenatum]